MIFQLIFSYITDYWKKQSAKEKFFIILIAIGFGFGMYHYSSKVYYKYKYFKQLETQVTILKDSILNINEREKEIIVKGKSSTTKAKTSSKAIDKKLKEDEKIIDDSDITDVQLDSLLAKYSH